MRIFLFSTLSIWLSLSIANANEMVFECRHKSDPSISAEIKVVDGGNGTLTLKSRSASPKTFPVIRYAQQASPFITVYEVPSLRAQIALTIDLSEGDATTGWMGLSPDLIFGSGSYNCDLK